MEVHHPHHPDHKKKWHEYMLEFLMLFLAVFLGFLVENFREHKVEKHRTEKHMQTMVENIKYDTTRFGSTLRFNLFICKGLDSFRTVISEAINGNVDANRLYYYHARNGDQSGTAITNPAAMTQLKSSGLFRMINNDSLAAQVGDYYERMYYGLEQRLNQMIKSLDIVRESYRQFFSYVGLDTLVERDSAMVSGVDKVRQDFIFGILRRDPPFELYTNDKVAFKKLYDVVSERELTIHRYNYRLRDCQRAAEDLMMHIKEIYHIQ